MKGKAILSGFMAFLFAVISYFSVITNDGRVFIISTLDADKIQTALQEKDWI